MQWTCFWHIEKCQNKLETKKYQSRKGVWKNVEVKSLKVIKKENKKTKRNKSIDKSWMMKKTDGAVFFSIKLLILHCLFRIYIYNCTCTCTICISIAISILYIIIDFITFNINFNMQHETFSLVFLLNLSKNGFKIYYGSN